MDATGPHLQSPHCVTAILPYLTPVCFSSELFTLYVSTHIFSLGRFSFHALNRQPSALSKVILNEIFFLGFDVQDILCYTVFPKGNAEVLTPSTSE